MHRTLRRVATATIATGGALALLTGTAAAHYCYRTDVPTGSKAAKGQAWHTKAETLQMFPHFLPDGPCENAVMALITSLPDNTLFMGPGLLAGGAVHQGKGPDGVGHIFADEAVVEACAPYFED